MIILDVHARDIVDTFVRDSILSSKENDLAKQLLIKVQSLLILRALFL